MTITNHSTKAPGVLVVGHGTRKRVGQEEFLHLVEQIRNLLPGVAVAGAFLELAEPGIDLGVRDLKNQGCDALIVMPILLFSAGHAKTDIPDAVRDAAEREGVRYLGISSPLETHRGVLELSKLRYEEALQADAWKGTVAMAMVGRGTSDRSALERMRELTRLRCEETTVAWNQTGFFAGGSPTVDELLDQAAESGCQTIVVQPHLLFEGELMDQLRAKVLNQTQRFPQQQWRLAPHLGASDELAKVFVDLLKQKFLPM